MKPKKIKKVKQEKKAAVGKNPEEMFMSGHSACPGCGAAIAMRHITNAVGKNTIISLGTGCMEVVSTSYPHTSWKIPTIHSAFENTAATAAGIESALKSLGKDKEIKVIGIAGDGGCYIPGTKILTINGLKNVEDLKVNEKVLSVNPITLGIEEMPIIRMHEYYYKDKIVKVRHNFVHFDVSLNHNIPVFNKFKGKIDIIKAYDLLNYGRSDKINILTGNLKWGGKTKKYFYLPKILYNKFSANKKIIEKMPMNLWLEFLGYWLSEGHLSIRSSKREKYNVFISQTNKKNINKIKLCLSRLPFNHWYSKDRFIISNQQLWAYLKQFGKAKEKFILKEFKGISVSQLKILFDALILGDGEVVRQKNSKVFRYSTISQKLKDDVIEIALKLGYRVHLDERKRKGRYEYAILCSDYKPTTLANLRRKNISSYDYRGKVYCPELKKNHVIIIEKDGRISLNMNSFDIGLQALSGAFERGHRILYICYDNEAYMNCLSTDSLIMTENGIKRIIDIKKGERIYAFNQKDHQLVLKRCSGIFDNGIKEVFELNTLHHTIKATANHPFLVLKRNGKGKKSYFVWNTLAQLKQSDEIIVLKNLNEGKSFRFKPIKISKKGDYKVNKINDMRLPKTSSPEFMEFLGLYVGDGWIRPEKAETGFALPRNKEGSKRLIEIYKKLFKKDIVQKNKDYIYIYSVNLSKFIDSLGFGKGAKNKIIPGWVFTIPQKEKEAFINGLMLSDGYRIGNSCRYVSASFDLLRTLRLLLQTTGYQVGKIHQQTKKKGVYVVYRQLLEDSTYGYVCFSKKKKADISKFLSQIKQRDFFADNEYFSTEKITSINFAGEEPTLDLRVEGEHNFIADGIVVHNTGIQRSSATPLHAATTTTPYLHKKHGKLEWKKNMPFIIASHNEHVYVATANIGYFADFDEKLRKALQHLEKGPAYLQVLTPCVPGWKYKESNTIKLAKLATDTKIYPLYEIEEGKIKLSEIEKAKPVESYLKEQGRFEHLAKEEINEIQARVDRDYEKLKRLSSLNEKIF